MSYSLSKRLLALTANQCWPCYADIPRGGTRVRRGLALVERAWDRQRERDSARSLATIGQAAINGWRYTYKTTGFGAKCSANTRSTSACVTRDRRPRPAASRELFYLFRAGANRIVGAAGFTYRQFEETGLMLVVADISCRFIQPASYDDLLRLVTTTVSAKGARVEHAYQILREDVLLAEGAAS